MYLYGCSSIRFDKYLYKFWSVHTIKAKMQRYFYYPIKFLLQLKKNLHHFVMQFVTKILKNIPKKFKIFIKNK